LRLDNFVTTGAVC